MKSQSQLAESMDRFKRAFWRREAGMRPPVGVVPDEAWQPIRYLRGPLKHAVLAEHATDYEHSFANRAVSSDDFMPYNAAWRAIPWLEAICGCDVRCAEGALGPGRFVDDWNAVTIAARPEWLKLLWAETEALAASLPDDCWVSPSILRGASDVLGAMRGLDAFFLDLADVPEELSRVAGEITALHLELLERHFEIVSARHGGYGHIYGYWSPLPTTVIQEDALGLCSPAVFERIFQRHSATMVERFAGHMLFHLHSTGYRHYRRVLDIPGLAGLELTVESNGPSLVRMIPDLRTMLERSRLILFVDAWFEQLREVLPKLPHDGLYLVVSNKFIATESEYRAFLANQGWR